MAPRTLLLAGGVTLAAVALVLAQQQPPPSQPPADQSAAPQQERGPQPGQIVPLQEKPAALTCRLSGPYTHDNLTVFLIHGNNQYQGKNFLTLPEALEQKKFVIHETQSVNQLAMENLSPNQEVIILSGDILKGGQQDRIAQYDLVVPPQSGKVPLPVFCVELTAARWMKPLSEKDRCFKDCTAQAASNSIRLSSRLHNSQGDVWKDVAEAQRKLSANAMKSVKVAESDSSLALSLQVKEVSDAADKYIAKLTPTAQDKTDAIGYAFAINGKIYTADVYGSADLFQKVWPRLLKASAIEAFAELEKDKKFEPVTDVAVRAFLQEAERGKAFAQDLGKELRQVHQESERNVLFETQDQKQRSVIRRVYVAK